MKRFSCLFVILLLAVGCTPEASEPRSGEAPTPETPAKEKAGPDEPTFGRWTIDVRLPEPRLGPLVIGTGEVRTAPRSTAKPWVQHDLIFRNLGNRPLHFDDTRTSKLATGRGRSPLLVADEGCGYGLRRPGAPIDVGACALYLDEFVIRPGDSVRREITLYKGLRGLADLRSNTYTFHKFLRFRVGESSAAQGHMVDVVYDIDEASEP